LRRILFEAGPTDLGEYVGRVVCTHTHAHVRARSLTHTHTPPVTRPVAATLSADLGRRSADTQSRTAYDVTGRQTDLRGLRRTCAANRPGAVCAEVQTYSTQPTDGLPNPSDGTSS
jgi:hypothetical protein